MLSHSKFLECFNFLAINYGFDLSKATLKLYYFSLKDISDIDFEKGIFDLIKNRSFSKMPNVCEIRKYCKADANSKANKAWLIVDKTASNPGTRCAIEFSDKKIVHAIKNIGGWFYLCSLSIEKFNAKRKEFIESYISVDDSCSNLKISGFYPNSRSVKIDCNDIVEDKTTKTAISLAS